MAGDSLSNLVSLLKLGTDQSTTTTSTSGKTVTKEQTDELIRKMLEGNQGLASVASGEKAAGLYNSSVNTQLTNDLLARSAGAAAGESTQATQSQTATTPKTLDPLKSLGVMALLDKNTRNMAKEGISSLSDFLSSSSDVATTGFDFGTSLDGVNMASSAGDYAASLDSLNWMENLSTASDVASTASAVGESADTVDWLTSIGSAFGF